MIAAALALRFPGGTTPESRDLIAAALLDFEVAAVHELTDTEWRVFFRTPGERDRAARALGSSCTVEPVDVEDEDWARRSQESLKAIAIGSLIVAPPWDIPEAGGQSAEANRQRPEAGVTGSNWPLGSDPSHLIVIQPSTGFGTGHHATTRLCLRALQRIDVEGKRVLDVGTGSGVLAIAAAKLGAASVTAVDNDADAIAAAAENVQRNRVNVRLLVADLERTRCDAADIVLANLTGAMLQRAADTLASLARGGMLIVSGLLDEEVAAVSRAFSPHLARSRLDRESGWSAFTFAITDTRQSVSSS